MTDLHGPSDAPDSGVRFDPPMRRRDRILKHQPDRLYTGPADDDGVVDGTEPAPPPKIALQEQPLGICLSGGGIRSASFSLGALQAFGRVGWLRRAGGARYLSAVSGGSYIAGAVTLAAQGSGATAQDGEQPRPVSADNPFSPGSPEEQYLRNHLLYLREAPGGIAAALARVVIGVTFNIAVLSLGLFLFGAALGAVYGWSFPGLRDSAGCGFGSPCPVRINVELPLRIGLVLSGAALVAGWGAVALRWANEGRRRVAYALAIALALLAAGELLFGAGIPKLLQLVRNAGATATEGHGLLPGGLGNVLAISGGSLAGLLGALVAGLRQPSTGAEPSGGKALGGLVRRGVARLREPLVNAAIAVLGPLLAGVLLLVFVNLGAYKTPLTPEWHWTWAVAVYGGALLGAGFLWKRADLVAWSLHPIYKRRLARAFAVRRIGSGAQVIGAEEIPYDQLPPLSKSQPPDFPELLVCAAANLSDYGKTPAGSNVASFVFSAATVGGGLMGEWNTEDLEELMNRNGRRDLTLATAIAVSGAAVSPAMGKMTRRPLRFLLAVGNVRLGIWLPNPLRSQTFADLPKDQPVFARPHYFFAELFGLNQLHHRYLYVSDGGHYENLGLVELLRRQCRTIWCVDASGDKEDTFSTIGQAIAIARAEHLVDDIEISPQEMAPDPKGDPRTVRRTHQTGQIRYSDGTTGKLVVIKIGVPATAPWDVTAFQRRNRFFPCDSTANQLYTAERFEAYRALGYYATMRALEEEAGAKERTVNIPVATDTEAAEAMARVLLQRLFEPVKMEVP